MMPPALARHWRPGARAAIHSQWFSLCVLLAPLPLANFVCMIPSPPEGAHPAGGCNRTGHLGAGLHTGDTCYARCADDYRVNATNGSLALNCSDDVLYPPNFTCIAVGPVVGVVEGCTVADPPDHAHPLGGCTSANGTWCENGAATKPTRGLFF